MSNRKGARYTISGDDFIKWSPDMAESFHVWEVMIPFGPVGKLQFRQEKFLPKEYETPEAQYEAVMDLLRGCRFSDTEYYVFCDDKLVTNL